MFDNATKLDVDFLTLNGIRSGMPPLAFEEKANDYYALTCAYVKDNDFFHPDFAEIEARLDTDEREKMFLKAQLKQMIYDDKGGRGAMIRGEDAKFNVCPDFVTYLRLAGFLVKALAALNTEGD
jgi:hypothetical protein